MGDYPPFLLAFSAILITHQHIILYSSASCETPQKDLPPTCLGQLARQSGGYCNPGEFIEIEFRLRFGCDVAKYIDQGVRFEIDIPTKRWSPIRFYTPTLTPPLPQEGVVPRVRLEPGGNSVEADAASYNSSLPLLHLPSVDGAEGVVIREYLCQDFTSVILSGGVFRLRWMQRYLSDVRADVATWSLDDIKVRVWDGNCFHPLLSEDFSSGSVNQPDGIRLNIMRGTVADPPCPTNSAPVAYFNEDFPGTTEFRRSLLLVLRNYTLGSCKEPEKICTANDDKVIEDGCPIIDEGLELEGSGSGIPEGALITCSYGNVSCGCGPMEKRTGLLTCESTTTETPPTTAEPIETTTEATPTTTEVPPTTTEPIVTTTEAPPTTTEPIMTTTEATTTTTEAPPTTTEPPPTTTEPVTTTEAAPTTTEAPPTTTEPIVTTTEATPTTTEAPPITTETPPKDPPSRSGNNDNNTVIMVNDTIIADPLYTVPLRVVNLENEGMTPELSLCYEVYGRANTHLNLISDSCVSANAHYTAVGPFHVINRVAIRAVDETNTCHDILVDVKDACSASIDGVPVDSFSAAGVSVRRFSERVRVSVPNCAQAKLVMWIFCQENTLQMHDGVDEEDVFLARMIKFVVARGFNLQPTSHGILGQFWNVPVFAERFEEGTTFSNGEPAEGYYRVTVSHPDSPARSFPAFRWHLTWERERRPCLYAGTSNAGRTGLMDGLNDPVIEGHYTDYILPEAFETSYKFSRFTATC